MKKALLVSALSASILFCKAQIYLGDNGLSTSGTGTSKKVSLGGTLNNAQTAIDFGSSNSSSNFLIKKGTTNYFYIDNNGKIGIGTTSPAEQLSIAGTDGNILIGSTMYGNNYNAIYLNGSSGLNYNFSSKGSDKNLYINRPSGNLIYIDENDVEQSAFGSGGSLGLNIGFNAPSAKLEINTTTASDGIHLRNSTTGFVRMMPNTMTAGSYNPLTQAGDGGLIFGATQQASGSNSTFGFVLAPWHHNAVGLRMDVNGNVGINQATPAAPLDVNGNIKATGFILPTGAAPNKVLVSTDANGTASWALLSTLGGGLWSDGGSGNVYGTSLSGNVGIGVNNPTSKLDVLMSSTSQPALTLKSIASQTANTFELKDAGGNSIVQMRSPDGTTYGQSTLTIDAGNKTNQPALTITNIGTGDAAMVLNSAGGGSKLMLTDFNYNHTPTWQYVNKHAAWWSNGNVFDANSPESFLFYHTSQPAANTLMTLRGQSGQTGDMLKIQNSSSTDIYKITATGGGYFADKVDIGANTSTDATYKLNVNGTIHSKKVKVDQDTWSDYVFDYNYRLPTLAEVQQYISNHKHLPDLPSADEVKKNGIDLGENQSLLLKKIEELTLYSIDQNKQIEEQNKKMENMQQQIDELKKLIRKN